MKEIAERIKQLEAEVKRLTHDRIRLNKLVDRITGEREEMLAEVKRLQASHAEACTQDLIRERDEARLALESKIRDKQEWVKRRDEALVDAETLARTIAAAIVKSCGLEPMGDMESEELQFQAKSKSIETLALDIADIILVSLSTEARALLDRLQRAEAVVEAAKYFIETDEGYGQLSQALAAWEEGEG